MCFASWVFTYFDLHTNKISYFSNQCIIIIIPISFPLFNLIISWENIIQHQIRFPAFHLTNAGHVFCNLIYIYIYPITISMSFVCVHSFTWFFIKNIPCYMVVTMYFSKGLYYQHTQFHFQLQFFGPIFLLF